MAKLNIGVVVGRFQVEELHKGHRNLLEAVIEKSDRLVILVGVSPVDGHTAENPLTFNQRVSLFQGYDAVIFPLFDEPEDKNWSIALDTLIWDTFPGNPDVILYGGRNSFSDKYTGKYSIETLSFEESLTLQGMKERAAIKESKDSKFLRGQIYSLANQYPKTYPTVDIALMRDSEDLLLIQRADTAEWVFPGGFVDPTDKSLEAAAKRELFEETGLSSDGTCDYITSKLVDDWRYRGSRDKIMTTLFRMPFVFGSPTPNPLEVQDFKWVHIIKARDIIAKHHLPLLDELIAAAL